MPWLFVVGTIVVMRRLERWLHQHIFKVGWLLTKRLQTTTIVYYLFFLPGVALHQATVWLTAGFFNVRAEGTFGFPKEQAIAELRLDFVQLGRGTPKWKAAVIQFTPFLVGTLVLWFIADRVLNVGELVTLFNTLGLDALDEAVTLLTRTPSFWLWAYIVFTIANTMLPSLKSIQLSRTTVILFIVAVIALFAAGIGEILLTNTLLSLTAAGIVLGSTFGVVIALDLFGVGLLGIIEAVYERITGDSAAFQNGKLVAIRREDLLKQRTAQAEKRTKQAQKEAQTRVSGTPSIYKLPFPMPGAPTKESVSVEMDIRALPPITFNPPGGVTAPPSVGEGRAGANLIVGTATPLTNAPPTRPPGISAPVSVSGASNSDYDEDSEESG